MKMPNCILRYCKKYSQRTKKSSEGITFHKFPRAGHDKREQWIKFVQKNRSEDTWLPSEHTCICSEHFLEQDLYITATGRRYLKKSAVPCENPKDCSEDNPNASPSSLIHVDVSDTESIFDSPREIKFKKDLRQVSAVKNILIEKNKKLKRQCRYLKARNQKLKDIVKKLKSKFPVERLSEKKQAVARSCSRGIIH